MGSNPIRTSESPAVPNASPAWTALTHGALTGSLAGLCAGLADLASTVLWLAPGVDRWRLAFALCALSLAIGAALGALSTALYALAARVTPRPFLRAAAVVSLPLTAVAHLLFTGGKMRRLPAQWLLQPLVALALVALCAWSLSRAISSLRSLRAAPPSRRWGLAGACAALGFALHGVDHRALPRLYEYLHAVLGALTLAAFGAAVWLVLAPPKPSRAMAFSVFALLVGALAWRQVTPWANVRAEVFGTHAPFVHHAAVALSSLTVRDEVVDPVALRRARFEREQRAPHAPGALPVIAGAHVLLITVDAMRADRVGRVVDGRSLTPRLDALAALGTRFDRVYCQAPHSSYSLSSLQTGEYLHETVPLGQAQPLATMADAVRAAGGHTAALYTRGIFFTESERLGAYRDGDYGFARSVHVDRNAREQTDAARAEIDDLARRGEPQGLLWVHYFDAHAPYQGGGRTPEQQYDGAVRAVDASIGALVDYARSTLARPVIVAVTADHGEEFGEHGGVYHGSTLYEEQVRVPLILNAPGIPPRVVRSAVELIDVAPTLLALSGVRAPATMRGADLRPRMVSDAADAPVFAAVSTRRMVLRWPFKLIADMAYGVDELYDLSSDPGERRNLAERDPARVRAMRADLAAWVESLAAAGAAGAVARARLGDRDAAPELFEIALSHGHSRVERSEALDALGSLGSLPDTARLRPLLRDADRAVASSAALVLGRAGDSSARGLLADLACAEDPRTRRAAGFALATLGDGRAVDVLIDALTSDDEATVLDAIRALGALGDARALEPLLALLPDAHVRYRAALALGQLGDRRAYAVLADLAQHDSTDDVRANAVAALGALGDRRAVPLLASLVTRERAEAYATEALGALGAIGREVDGWDARHAQTSQAQGFSRCAPHDDTLGWRYLAPWSCVTGGASAWVSFASRPSDSRLLVLRVRRGNDGPEVPLTVSIDAREVARTTLSTRWQEHRIALQGLTPGPHRWTLSAQNIGNPGDPPTIAIDHLALLP